MSTVDTRPATPSQVVLPRPGTARLSDELAGWLRGDGEKTLGRLIDAFDKRAFGHRLSNVVFGLLVASGSIAAFVAPPFTGLDTLPALAVVLVSLGVLLENFRIVVVGLVVGATGIALEIIVGGAALEGLKSVL